MRQDHLLQTNIHKVFLHRHNITSRYIFSHQPRTANLFTEETQDQLLKKNHSGKEKGKTGHTLLPIKQITRWTPIHPFRHPPGIGIITCFNCNGPVIQVRVQAIILLMKGPASGPARANPL